MVMDFSASDVLSWYMDAINNSLVSISGFDCFLEIDVNISPSSALKVIRSSSFDI